MKFLKFKNQYVSDCYLNAEKIISIYVNKNYHSPDNFDGVEYMIRHEALEIDTEDGQQYLVYDPIYLINAGTEDDDFFWNYNDKKINFAGHMFLERACQLIIQNIISELNTIEDNEEINIEDLVERFEENQADELRKYYIDKFKKYNNKEVKQ